MVRLHPEVRFPKLLLVECPTVLVRRFEANQFAKREDYDNIFL